MNEEGFDAAADLMLVSRILRNEPLLSIRHRPKWPKLKAFCCLHLKIRIKLLLFCIIFILFLVIFLIIRRDLAIELTEYIEADSVGESKGTYLDDAGPTEIPEDEYLHNAHCVENGKIATSTNGTCRSQLFIGRRGPYTILYNYVLAEKKFERNESVTFCTHATYHLLPHVEVLCRKWNGPISVAVHAPGYDFTAAIHVIEFLRTCGNSCVKKLVTFHLFFDRSHPPPFSIIPFEGFSGNSSSLNFLVPSFSNRTIKNCKSFSSPVLKTPRSSFKAMKKLVYPINVARNVARQTASTFYVLSADIELYPSRGIVPMFLKMVSQLSDTVLQRPNPRVYVLPIFEVPRGSRPPTCKSELVNLFRLGRAIFFHKFVCPACSLFPRLEDWVKQTPTSGRIKVFHVAKRYPPYHRWEPIYIGTHSEPPYDERLTWEGKQDKMSQMHALCLLDYDLDILDNAFLVHAPGIKQRTITTSLQFRRQKMLNDRIHHQVVQHLNVKYGKKPFCI